MFTNRPVNESFKTKPVITTKSEGDNLVESIVSGPLQAATFGIQFEYLPHPWRSLCLVISTSQGAPLVNSDLLFSPLRAFLDKSESLKVKTLFIVFK